MAYQIIFTFSKANLCYFRLHFKYFSGRYVLENDISKENIPEFFDGTINEFLILKNGDRNRAKFYT